MGVHGRRVGELGPRGLTLVLASQGDGRRGKLLGSPSASKPAPYWCAHREELGAEGKGEEKQRAPNKTWLDLASAFGAEHPPLPLWRLGGAQLII